MNYKENYYLFRKRDETTMAELKKSQAKYQQCLEKIKRYINVNHLVEGDRLPTEPQMMEALGVSRITVRRAISELEAQGVVKRIQGSGTFLSAPPTLHLSQPAIPMVLPGDNSDNGLLSLIQGAGDCLAKYSCRTTNYFANYGGEDEERILRQLAAAGEKCVMVFPCDDRVNRHLFPELERQGMKFIYLGRRPTWSSGSFVGSDDVSGGYQAVCHLVEQGYSRIAFLSGAPASTAHSIPGRLLGYQQALEAHGLPYNEAYVRCVEDHENFADVLADMMALEPRPDAFFCVNDITAVELMYRLEPYQIPGQPRTAVVGFDNSSILKSLPFALTTVEQSFYQTGYEAAETAVQILTHDPAFAVHKILPVKLIVRDTTPRKGE